MSYSGYASVIPQEQPTITYSLGYVYSWTDYGYVGYSNAYGFLPTSFDPVLQFNTMNGTSITFQGPDGSYNTCSNGQPLQANFDGMIPYSIKASGTREWIRWQFTQSNGVGSSNGYTFLNRKYVALNMPATLYNDNYLPYAFAESSASVVMPVSTPNLFEGSGTYPQCNVTVGAVTYPSSNNPWLTSNINILMLNAGKTYVCNNLWHAYGDSWINFFGVNPANVSDTIIAHAADVQNDPYPFGTLYPITCYPDPTTGINYVIGLRTDVSPNALYICPCAGISSGNAGYIVDTTAFVPSGYLTGNNLYITLCPMGFLIQFQYGTNMPMQYSFILSKDGTKYWPLSVLGTDAQTNAMLSNMGSENIYAKIDTNGGMWLASTNSFNTVSYGYADYGQGWTLPELNIPGFALACYQTCQAVTGDPTNIMKPEHL